MTSLKSKGLLLHGIDTLQCAYYLSALGRSCGIDFSELRTLRKNLRNRKSKYPEMITLGDTLFLLASHGTSSGYPFLLTNEDFKIGSSAESVGIGGR